MVYKMLEKEISELSDTLGVVRSTAFNLSISASNSNEAVAATQIEELSAHLKYAIKQLNDIKRWANDISDSTKS